MINELLRLKDLGRRAFSEFSSQHLQVLRLVIC